MDESDGAGSVDAVHRMFQSIREEVERDRILREVRFPLIIMFYIHMHHSLHFLLTNK